MISYHAIGDVDQVQERRTFRYKHLDTSKRCIRLLRVLSRQGQEMIPCEIEHANLDDNIPFIALSYTWDQAEGTQKYIVCGDGAVQIGKNLWDFLNRYSQESEFAGIRLWVDAVCIDQTNLQERNHQVSLMRTIYTNAQTVIAWLGVPTGDEDVAFRIADYATLDSMAGQHAIENVFKKRYWSRVWIVQEIILPRTVRIWCGDLSVNADAFDLPWPTRLLQRLKRQGCAWQILGYRKIWHSQESGRGGGDAFYLCQLIRAFASSESSERLDKIYGFLGLASVYAGYEARIEVDYSISALQLLVSVLRFERDTGADEDHLLADLQHLKTLLGVTSMELVASLPEIDNDLLPHLYALLGCDEVEITLEFVSKKISVQDPAQPQRAQSTKLAGLKRMLSTSSRTTPESIPYTPDEALVKKANEACWQGLQLEPHLDGYFIMDSAKVLLAGMLKAWDKASAAPHRPSRPDRESYLFLESFERKIWASAIRNDGCLRYDHYLTANPCVRLSFTGTEGTRGILVTYDTTAQKLLHSTCDVEIWRLAVPGPSEHGLLIERNTAASWDAIGIAIYRTALGDPPRTECPLWARLQLPDLYRMLRYLSEMSRPQLHALYRLWLSDEHGNEEHGDDGRHSDQHKVNLWPAKGPPSRHNNWDDNNHAGEVPHAPWLPPEAGT